MAVLPDIDGDNGPEEAIAAAASFELKLSAEMKDLAGFTTVEGQSIGQFQQYETDGTPSGSPIDIFTIAGLGNNRYGELNHWDESTHNHNKRAARHAGWYDKKHAQCVRHIGPDNNKNLRLYSAVVQAHEGEFEHDDIHHNVVHQRSGEAIDFTQFNICVPWLTTFGADYNIDPHDMWVPDASKPNITIEKNSYTEIRVKFDGYQSTACRTSLWLIPATKNNDPGTTVKFDDDNPLDAHGGQNFIQSPYHAATNPADGVEIDIFEYEKSENPANHNWLIMKSIGDLGDTSKWTVNTLMAGPGINGADARVNGIGSDWHTIGLLWVEDRTVWFVDGKAYVKDEVNIPNNVRMQIVLSREVTAGNIDPAFGSPSNPGIFADNGAGAANRSVLDDDFVEIEYVRVWQISDYSPSASATAQRYGADNGEIFWDKNGHTEFNVYRDGVFKVNSVGSSFYDDTLISGQEYHYEIKVWRSGMELLFSAVDMPGSPLVIT